MVRSGSCQNAVRPALKALDLRSHATGYICAGPPAGRPAAHLRQTDRPGARGRPRTHLESIGRWWCALEAKIMYPSYRSGPVRTQPPAVRTQACMHARSCSSNQLPARYPLKGRATALGLYLPAVRRPQARVVVVRCLARLRSPRSSHGHGPAGRNGAPYARDD